MTAARGLPHQRLVGRLFILLQKHVETRGLGEVFVSPVDCILSDTTIVQPDVVYLEYGRSSLASARGIEGAPTLAVEILSASTARLDRGSKLQLLKSKESFMSWQSILRGVGVYSGCTRCVDVCPVGRDYDAHLKDAQDEIAERTPEKEARLAAMARSRESGDRGPHHGRSARWIEGPASG